MNTAPNSNPFAAPPGRGRGGHRGGIPGRGGPGRGGPRGGMARGGMARGGPRFAAPQSRFTAPASSGPAMFAAPPLPQMN